MIAARLKGTLLSRDRVRKGGTTLKSDTGHATLEMNLINIAMRLAAQFAYLKTVIPKCLAHGISNPPCPNCPPLVR